MAGDNNLEENGYVDLRKMKDAMTKPGADEAVTVLTQFDPRAEGVTTKRYEVSGRESQDFPESDVAEDLGIDTNTGEPAVLREFLRWGIRRSPAERYAVVIWNHGNGVDDTNIYRAGSKEVRRRTRRPPVFGGAIKRLLELSLADNTYMVANDDTSQDFLDNLELQKALEAVRNDPSLGLTKNLDLVCMDACYMSMAEIYHQLRRSVSYAVGSEEITPLMGWPYTEVLDALCARPDADAASVAGMMVDKYLDFYADQPNEPVTISACDLSLSGRLKGAVDDLSAALLRGLSDPALVRALMVSHFQAQSYSGMKYVDLPDFCALLEDNYGGAEVGGACRALVALAGEPNYVLKSGFRGRSVRFSRGISVYLPHNHTTPTPLYDELDFSQGSGPQWIDFLRRYMEVTSRPDQS
jgi:hypothetical protein